MINEEFPAVANAAIFRKNEANCFALFQLHLPKKGLPFHNLGRRRREGQRRGRCDGAARRRHVGSSHLIRCKRVVPGARRGGNTKVTQWKRSGRREGPRGGDVDTRTAVCRLFFSRKRFTRPEARRRQRTPTVPRRCISGRHAQASFAEALDRERKNDARATFTSDTGAEGPQKYQG